ncbi:MAG: hypothetical protein AAFQ82_22325, partial [Myxococcota bacterium]
MKKHLALLAGFAAVLASNLACSPSCDEADFGAFATFKGKALIAEGKGADQDTGSIFRHTLEIEGG